MSVEHELERQGEDRVQNELTQRLDEKFKQIANEYNALQEEVLRSNNTATQTRDQSEGHNQESLH